MSLSGATSPIIAGRQSTSPLESFFIAEVLGKDPRGESPAVWKKKIDLISNITALVSRAKEVSRAEQNYWSVMMKKLIDGHIVMRQCPTTSQDFWRETLCQL